MSNSRRYFETREQQKIALGSFREQLYRYPCREVNEFYDCMNFKQWLLRRGVSWKHPGWRGWMQNQRRLRKAIKRKLP